MIQRDGVTLASGLKPGWRGRLGGRPRRGGIRGRRRGRRGRSGGRRRTDRTWRAACRVPAPCCRRGRRPRTGHSARSAPPLRSGRIPAGKIDSTRRLPPSPASRSPKEERSPTAQTSTEPEHFAQRRQGRKEEQSSCSWHGVRGKRIVPTAPRSREGKAAAVLAIFACLARELQRLGLS